MRQASSEAWPALIFPEAIAEQCSATGIQNNLPLA